MSEPHPLTSRPLPSQEMEPSAKSGEKREDKRRALGRGLDSLLPPRPRPSITDISASSQLTEQSGQPLEIPLIEIDPNPFQTRTNFDEAKLTELSQSIAATGVVQPIVVRQLANRRYQLITGERRLRASKLAGKQTIPAILRTTSDEHAMEMTIVENLQRADLNPIEQARAYFRLSNDFRMTQEQMAIRTGKDRATVANFLRLLRLPEAIQEKVELGELSFGHARALLSLVDAEKILAASQKVIALAMSVRQTESYIQGLLNPQSRQAKPAKPELLRDPNVHEAESRLQQILGLRVHIEDRKGRGRVIIEYAGLEDFDSLLTALNVQSAN